tara:strand:+ start:2092 stop:3012 length:921 start_codon:yes stop_codon:yes gene_type:complete
MTIFDDDDVEPDHDDEASFTSPDDDVVVDEEEAEEESEEDDAEADDDEDDVEGDDEPETVSVKYGDVEYTVPKGLEKAIMQEADYTQKSQGLAQEREALAGERQAAEAAHNMQGAQFEEAVKLAAIDARLAEYDEVDWQQLLQTDQHNGTNIAQQLDLERRQLTDSRSRANEELAAKSQQVSAYHREAMVKSAEKTRSALSAKYADWSPSLEESMARFAIGLGVPEQQLRTTTNQATLEILYKAHKFDLVEQQRATAKEKKPAPKPAVPAAKVKGRKQGGRPNPDKMSTKDWVSWREKQLAKKEAS